MGHQLLRRHHHNLNSQQPIFTRNEILVYMKATRLLMKLYAKKSLSRSEQLGILFNLCYKKLLSKLNLIIKNQFQSVKLNSNWVSMMCNVKKFVLNSVRLNSNWVSMMCNVNKFVLNSVKLNSNWVNMMCNVNKFVLNSVRLNSNWVNMMCNVNKFVLKSVNNSNLVLLKSVKLNSNWVRMMWNVKIFVLDQIIYFKLNHQII